ncbi:hypothetical protein [Fluviispira multicolorata]|uniref:Uncharacterized protein n=1 Tax=Fluviispira multicolorata TaxID=2654512 RepID=A0A833JBU6_9BACT|nr:hypothetical protein [Fluviispira multicolorata]KAB8029818.1 hypothetical protein GCL57_09775 [Fluviispira multicolorata]
MIKKIFFLILFLSFQSQASALKVEAYNNFTRFIFEPRDFQANQGSLNNTYWYYPGYSAFNGCAATTTPIFLTKKAHLSGYVTIKSTAYTWIESPRDLARTQLFQVKAFSQFAGLNQEILSAPFYLSELKDIRTLYYERNSSYIEAKTEDNQFINSKLMFNNRNDAWEKLSFCIANISERTEISISGLTIDAIY